MLQPRDLKGRNAISYARWSSGRQAKGDSLRRQTENAREFCATYGLSLDLALVDDGVSAFKGANLEASLGKFVIDVKSGKIAKDVVLIVENIDRITRVKPTQAIRYFLGLLDTGLTLVTLTDQRVHTAEGYDDNFANLMMSLMAMQAAYEYSAKISFRVGSSWVGRVKAAKEGGRVRVSKVPFWIDQKTQQFNDRVEDARLVFKLAKQGVGQTAITNRLNEQHIPSSRGGTWGKSMVQDVLKSPAAYGSLVLKGEEIRDYFPALISETEWLAIQHQHRSRHRNSQADSTRNLFPRLLRCGRCGSAMNMTSSRFSGKVFSYLVCSGKALRRTSCNQPNVKYDELEGVLVEQLGFLAVMERNEAKASTAGSPASEIEDAIKALEFKQRNVLDGIAEADTPEVRRVLLAQADAISKNIGLKKKELTSARETAARYASVADATPEELDAYAEEIQRLAKVDRKEARRLIGDVLERIDLDTDDEGTLHVSISFFNKHASVDVASE
ncbi:recombinase family protein [Mesorhizobium sp. M1E.F.Ca.ET.041.01.1.1]|uniref:recombinase family protein n=1 Tax=Mesorhizobium sp. M1E.F.Ca.ET.041.01.1.1 TaxID=2496759 RepID=UPI000FCB5D97|nr:recombinase family protein [Mesorhizobium sp. M1E.F.Ca.ET.041.01.1.1]RUW24952.1 recombinase family protein [Mesorhizobium sp. M1E.F.Ca.ET.041.01.1.1]RWD92384.1 MAG: recombinase family protein [Mesorhizobium sp.]